MELAFTLKKFTPKFLSTLETAGEKLKRIPPDKSAVKPASDKWSAKEILGHLILWLTSVEIQKTWGTS